MAVAVADADGWATGEGAASVVAVQAAAQVLDEVGPSRLRGSIGKLRAQRPVVARSLIEVDVADHHADAVAVEGFVDRHQLRRLGHAGAADAEDLDGVADI